MRDFSQFVQNEIAKSRAFGARPDPRPSNWAIVRLCFNGEDNLTTAAPALNFYERLFTGKGSGSLNVTEFFSDISHGQLDLSASKVFGWMTIDASRSDYVGGIADNLVQEGKFNRGGLLSLCHQTALDNKVPLNDYDGVVYSFAGALDLFGMLGGMLVVCDTNSLWPSLLGQEMGHGYGLDHSRADGSQADYMDIWDIMSTNVGGTFSSPDTEYNFVGPGINASNMRSRGWLDEGRVWRPQHENFGTQDVVLRPLHRRDLSGFLAAELGPYLVEFRPAVKWDSGLQGGSGVLVHRFDESYNCSYVMGPPATQVLANPFAAHPLRVGEIFRIGDDTKIFETVYSCEVTNIDADTATVRLHYRPGATIPGPNQRPFEIGFVGNEVGSTFFQGGTVHRIQPYGLIIQIMRHLDAYTSATSINDIGMRSLGQADALSGVINQAARALRALNPERSPAPPPDAKMEKTANKMK